jgi:hypothetical protein
VGISCKVRFSGVGYATSDDPVVAVAKQTVRLVTKVETADLWQCVPNDSSIFGERGCFWFAICFRFFCGPKRLEKRTFLPASYTPPGPKAQETTVQGFAVAIRVFGIRALVVRELFFVRPFGKNSIGSLCAQMLLEISAIELTYAKREILSDEALYDESVDGSPRCRFIPGYLEKSGPLLATSKAVHVSIYTRCVALDDFEHVGTRPLVLLQLCVCGEREAQGKFKPVRV